MRDQEHCSICGCKLHRTTKTYAQWNVDGRSHATKHHLVAQRLFKAEVFKDCPWGHKDETAIFCYECHEILLHNPVLLPKDIAIFSELVKARELSESQKTENTDNLAGRVQLFNEIISAGLAKLSQKQND